MQYNYQVWRQQRNEKVIEVTEKHSRDARKFLKTLSADSSHGLTFLPHIARCRWEKPVTTISINGLPMSLAFHAYDPHLVIANESDMITYVTRYEQRELPRSDLSALVYGIGSRRSG